MPLLADEAKESRLCFCQSDLREPWIDQKSREAGSKLSLEGLGVRSGYRLHPYACLKSP